MRKIFYIVLIGVTFFGLAQDAQYSQYFANPMALNPAFAGTSSYHRFTAAYRLQWPNLPRTFVNYTAGYDVAFPEFNSGVGVLFSADKAGSGNLSSTRVEFIYSYSAALNDKWVFQPALSFGILSRTLDYQKLLFGDQIDFGVPGSPTVDPTASQVDAVNTVDIATGFLFYGQKLWLGAAYYHINRPNISLLQEVNELPEKLMVHAGYRFDIKRGPMAKGKNPTLAPTILFKKQGRFSQLDAGITLDTHPVSVGVFYRGVPFMEDPEGRFRNEAVIMSLGIDVAQFAFGYSYDINVARLGPETGGAHEITLRYLFSPPDRPGKIKRKNAKLPCPAFARELPF